MPEIREMKNVFVVQDNHDGPPFYFSVVEHYSGEHPDFTTEALSIHVHDMDNDGIEVFVTAAETAKIGLMLIEFALDHPCKKKGLDL